MKITLRNIEQAYDLYKRYSKAVDANIGDEKTHAMLYSCFIDKVRLICYESNIDCTFIVSEVISNCIRTVYMMYGNKVEDDFILITKITAMLKLLDIEVIE